jgi:hypothetical protein
VNNKKFEKISQPKYKQTKNSPKKITKLVNNTTKKFVRQEEA